MKVDDSWGCIGGPRRTDARRTIAGGLRRLALVLVSVFVASTTVAQSAPAKAPKGPERVVLFVWGADASVDARADTLVWTILGRLGQFERADFRVHNDAALKETFRTSFKKAESFVRADRDGRRNPESMEHATSAFFAAKNALGDLSVIEVAKAHALLGVTSQRDGQEDLAQGYFLTALHLEEASKDWVVRLAPDIEGAVLAADRERALAKRETVRLSGTPSGAVIVLDGEAVGTLPMPVEARAGGHLVQLSAPGHFPAGWMVDFGSARFERRMKLKAHPSLGRFDRAASALQAAVSSAGDGETYAGLTEKVADLIRLTGAKRLLAIQAVDAGGQLQLSGFASGGQGPVPINLALTKDASMLDSLEKSLGEVLGL